MMNSRNELQMPSASTPEKFNLSKPQRRMHFHCHVSSKFGALDVQPIPTFARLSSAAPSSGRSSHSCRDYFDSSAPGAHSAGRHGGRGRLDAEDRRRLSFRGELVAKPATGAPFKLAKAALSKMTSSYV
jgi:hypothetical protein